MSNDPNLLRGQKPGDRRVRIKRPESRYFRYVGPGVVVARPAAIEPRTRLGHATFVVRRALFGHALASEAEITERLPKWKALPVFSSDAMSSVAYGPEAAMYTLLAAGTIAFAWLMPIMGVILVILLLITLSYRQTIRAYPNGGGSYIVAHANLGQLPGLVAAARGDRKPGFDHAAAPWYSWMSPPSRSRRRTPRGPTDSVSLGSARGGASPRARWGRCRL